MAPVPTEHDNALDQHVVYFLRKHPEFYQRHTISRIQPGRYNLDGRAIAVEWHYGENGEDGFLVAVDGPLRQPFADYVQGTETNAQFDRNRLPVSSLQQIPKESQLSFGDMHQVVSRLEAMKIAKEQAAVREMAAEYTKDGQLVPQSALIERYKKTIDKKLGNQNRRQPKTAPAAAPPPAAEPPAAPGQSRNDQQNANLNPVFCPNHDSTEKRKKVASRQVECPICKEAIQTNYAEFSMCHACSRRDNRCLCCGTGVGSGQQMAQAQGQGTPAYCANHSQSEQRKKTQPRNVQCASCKVTIQTNYVDFTLCANCSQAEQRCVCCGGSTKVQSTPPPVSGVGFPQLQSLQMHPNQLMNRLPSQCSLQPAPLAAHNAFASQNVFASYNRMTSMKAF